MAGLTILVVNAGSSSLKLALVEDGTRIVEERQHPPAEGEALESALAGMLERSGTVDAAGHRVVHGGERFAEPLLLHEAEELELRKLAELAPLHNPPALAAIDSLRRLRPELRSIACFDTAFHRTLPPRASTYALPAAWADRWQLRRFGFHGISHAWVAGRLAELVAGARRIVSCHLGAGASLAAIVDGRSVDTTMGFTPLEGLVMATRSGSIDPGLLLWVQRHGGIAPEAAEQALDREAGLLGISRHSADMHELIAAADQGDERSQLAFDVYVHRLRAAVAAMAAAMGGLDALAFTGGVGENSARVRAQTAAGLRFLGLGIDDDLNDEARPDAIISPPDAPVPTLVIRAREELEIAREVEGTLTART